ncbi:MAG: hypothetical protein K0R98_1635 [Rickettsiaceae bacterium]|jgi:hypothetical protein|nr:hypothetical protein [Rickettsiaceae bacterium]
MGFELKNLDKKISLVDTITRLPNKLIFKEPDQEISFEDSVKKLGGLLGKEGKTIGELAEIVGNALATGDKKVQSAFFVWVGSIHNDRLTGVPYPKNIVYDIISALGKENDLSPEATLLRLFVEGSNARKKSSGTPGLSWISTALMVDALAAYKELGNTLSADEQKFFDTYKDVKNCDKIQTAFESKCRSLTTGEVKNATFALLETNKALDFKRERNQATGANKYFIDSAIETGKELLAGVSVSDADVKALTDVAKYISEGMLQATGEKTAEDVTKRKDYAISAWDASEWLSRVYVTLEAVAQAEGSKHPNAAEIFENDPILKDLIARSREGNFPGGERNEALKNVGLKEIFLQDELSKSQGVALFKRDFNLIETGLQK